jgi:TetR/AcrR family transcriptional regulator, transcriptional repressor for nem operon
MHERPFGLMHSALHFDTRPVGLDIAQKGAPLFNQKRCAGTPLADLMAATGLQKDGIYRHFSSKQELATAAFDYSWRKAVGGRLDGVTDVTDPVNRLRKMIGNFVEIRAVWCRRLPPEEHHPAKADDGNAVLRARARWASQSRTECPHYITRLRPGARARN